MTKWFKLRMQLKIHASNKSYPRSLFVEEATRRKPRKVRRAGHTRSKRLLCPYSSLQVPRHLGHLLRVGCCRSNSGIFLSVPTTDQMAIGLQSNTPVQNRSLVDRGILPCPKMRVEIFWTFPYFRTPISYRLSARYVANLCLCPRQYV